MLFIIIDLLHAVSQMPVVLIPIHFDRNPEDRPFIPSCRRSVVIRTFITADFMTGIPATPGHEIPVDVRHHSLTTQVLLLFFIFLRKKP